MTTTHTALTGNQPPLSPEVEPVVAALLNHQILAEEADPEQFRLVCHHRHEITRWFSEYPGWRFHVERQAGIGRLYKRDSDPRPAASLSCTAESPPPAHPSHLSFRS